MNIHQLLATFFLSLIISGGCYSETYDWDKAESEIVKLQPEQFAELPLNIITNLKVDGCLIPQTYRYPEIKPHNVISGSFEKPGQLDWAVLCSLNGI